MYPHSFLWHYLWIAPHALQLIIAIAMVRRRLVREFPVFFVYTVSQIVAQGTLFILDHLPAVSGDQYWEVHWAASLIQIGLRFGVIREIMVYVFRDYHGLGQLTRIVFRSAVVILLFLATAAVAYAPQAGGFLILSRVHVLDLFVDVIQAGLWLVVVALSFHFGLTWRNFPYGIAFGMGIFLTVDVAIEAIRLWTGFVAGYAFDVVSMATYHCCVIVWLVYLLAPETARRTLKDLPKNDLEQWNAELQRLLLQ